jgi:hypothetical protein
MEKEEGAEEGKKEKNSPNCSKYFWTEGGANPYP